MPTRTVLSAAELDTSLRNLPGWSVLEGKLHRKLIFASFREAFAFMTAAALLAERMNHHPEWFNVYNRITLDLMTHDAGGITGIDLDFAREAERVAQGLGAREA